VKLHHTSSVIALLAGMTLALPTTAAAAAAAAATGGAQLEELIVTAQKREENVQTAPLSISAVSGATLAKDRVLTLEDLGHNMTGISFTANSPQANEINIRGVVNTRLTSPTADQSVSTFVDDVYVSRSGNLNSAFYDVSRIEVVMASVALPGNSRAATDRAMHVAKRMVSRRSPGRLPARCMVRSSGRYGTSRIRRGFGRCRAPRR